MTTLNGINPEVLQRLETAVMDIFSSHDFHKANMRDVAKRAGIPNSNTVKDVEYGRDAKLSNIEAIAKVLGLKLELVEV